MKYTLDLRHIGFAFFTLVVTISFSGLIMEWLEFSLGPQQNRTLSHMVLIPLVSAGFFYQRRTQICSQPRYSLFWGAFPVLVGILALYLASRDRLEQNDYLCLMMFSIVAIWTGGFISFYGLSAL